MKRFATTTVSFVAAAALLVVMTGMASAASSTSSSSSMPSMSSSQDTGKLNAAITMLNSYKNIPQGDQLISKQLSDNFKISSDKVSSLLSSNMQYGDVAALLAFADKMPGGVTDANINKIKTMKSSAGGWDQIAKNLNVKLSDINSKLDSFEDSAHKNIKQALADSFSSGTAAGGPNVLDQGSGGATGGTGTTGTPGGMYGTDNGSYGTGGISGGGAGGSSDSGMSGGSQGGSSSGSMDQPSSGSSANPHSGY